MKTRRWLALEICAKAAHDVLPAIFASGQRSCFVMGFDRPVIESTHKRATVNEMNGVRVAGKRWSYRGGKRWKRYKEAESS